MVIKLGDKILDQGYEAEGLMNRPGHESISAYLKVIDQDTIIYNNSIYLTSDIINKRSLIFGENIGCIPTLLRKERQFLPLTWEPSESDFGRRR